MPTGIRRACENVNNGMIQGVAPEYLENEIIQTFEKAD